MGDSRGLRTSYNASRLGFRVGSEDSERMKSCFFPHEKVCFNTRAINDHCYLYIGKAHPTLSSANHSGV
jgi:hypothetical protein